MLTTATIAVTMTEEMILMKTKLHRVRKKIPPTQYTIEMANLNASYQNCVEMSLNISVKKFQISLKI